MNNNLQHKLTQYANLDINFDFQTEAGFNRAGVQRDSDKHSSTLQEYHRILWSKPLPSRELFELTKISGNRLYHKSGLGEYFLSSDWGAVTLSGRNQVKAYISSLNNKRVVDFQQSVVNIGARIIWPSNRIDGSSTINGMKGMNYLISDRLDLTIECIRRYYIGETSPLYETLKRYDNFFALFENFNGYIDFFLLQDYVGEDYSSVNIAQPFDDFHSSPVPKSVDEYYEYIDKTEFLIHARNKRILEYVRGQNCIE